MKDTQEQIDKYEGILWDLENANRLSNPSDDKKKKKKIEQTKKKIASLKKKLDESKTIRLSKSQLRRIVKEAIISESGYEGRYFDQHGTGKYSPDEQFSEDIHFILDTSPSYKSYWRQAYEVIEALDDDEKYMGEVIAEKMWERHTNRNYDYRY